MENRQSLPQYLKQLRKAHSYRQEDIAARLQVSRQTYSHYETGRIRPSIHVLYHLARIYGVSTDNILRHMEIDPFNQQTGEEQPEVSSLETTGGIDSLSEKELLECLHSLNEKNRRDTMSIMWEIIQAKKNLQDSN